MTKEEYILWKETRGPVDNWDVAQCKAADKLIKETTLKELRVRLSHYPDNVINFIELMCRCHFGSVETDEFLQSLNAYPDWM